MSSMKAINASEEEIITIEDHVKHSEDHKNEEGTRTFDYKLSDKATKAKLLKAAKRVPFEWKTILPPQI